MKKKVFSLILTVFMVLSIAMPAFAEGTESGSVTYDNDNGSDIADQDTFDESGSQSSDIDMCYSLAKGAGQDDNTKDYYVEVSWEKTNGSVTSGGDTYYWDASQQKYIRKENGVSNSLSTDNSTPAEVTITVKNYSNADIDYAISYATETGYDTTESKQNGSNNDKTGTIASFITSNNINGIENNATTGESEYDYSNNSQFPAPQAEYKGQVSLNANDKTAAAWTEAKKVGTYTVKIQAHVLQNWADTMKAVTETKADSNDTTLSYAKNGNQYVEVTVPTDAQYDSNNDGTADTAITAGTDLKLKVTPSLDQTGGITLTSSQESTSYDVSLLATVGTEQYKVGAVSGSPIKVKLYVGNVDIDKFYHGTDDEFTKVKESELDTAGEYYYKDGYVYFMTDSFSPYTAVYKFGGGQGTEESPYLIGSAAQMQEITNQYDKGYKYYKVKDGVETIDCNGWIPVKLNGSFDGNDVNFTNVTAWLFKNVGYKLQKDTITLKNFSATMKISSPAQYGSAALIKQIDNGGTTTFDNVDVHGTIEGYWNIGSYYNYGTANYDDKGCDYRVDFFNCHSDATLICTSGNTCGGFLGHGYEGAGHTQTLNIDSTNSYTGTIYTTNGNGGHYMAMNSTGSLVFNGVTTSRYDSSFTSYDKNVKIASVAPTKDDNNGYKVNVQTSTARVVVAVNAQLDAYESDNTTKIQNLSGITMTLNQTELTNATSETTLLENVTSATINNSAENYGYTLNNGVMTLNVPGNANYLSGTVRLTVTQYGSDGTVLCCGTTDVFTITNSSN